MMIMKRQQYSIFKVTCYCYLVACIARVVYSWAKSLVPVWMNHPKARTPLPGVWRPAVSFEGRHRGHLGHWTRRHWTTLEQSPRVSSFKRWSLDKFCAILGWIVENSVAWGKTSLWERGTRNPSKQSPAYSTGLVTIVCDAFHCKFPSLANKLIS